MYRNSLACNAWDTASIGNVRFTTHLPLATSLESEELEFEILLRQQI